MYSESTGARVVAGTVVLNRDKTKVLLVSSAANPDLWVLPKGGVEQDEKHDLTQTALRETWEEAGVIGKITKYLGVVDDLRPPKAWKQDHGQETWPPRTEFHFYEMSFERAEDQWPESNRRRKWETFSKAVERMHENGRPELARAISMSSILRD